ncbi:leucine-rich repeat domain-containing protein [uncultured Bacteroides sp.]|uniref:leucine-rich repeat domain-containing protein n=1 Tax=uncultured Bacteroides sp. TaxID=162156 RepID=UPI00262D749E|nr:leucine-rich repeat domain-containing protein [uncultured Bacteroides sp.]
MKTTRILSLAAAVLTLAACGNEEFIENNPGNEAAKPVPMTFTAGMPQTRTQLDGLNVHWVEYDQIALWDGSGEYQKFDVDAESINGSNATFSGTALPDADYTAFYPLIAVESMDGTSVTFNLPAEQTAVAGTFANQLAPSLAKATGGSTNLVFDNLCALVKFTVPDDMAGEGTFTLVGGNATEALAGKLTCNTADGTLTATEPATRITLKGSFTAGQAYYFVVMPGTLADGFSLLYEDSKSKLYRKATGNSVTLQAGHILNLGTLALTGFDKAVTTGMVADDSSLGTRNADGTTTLTILGFEGVSASTTLTLNNAGMTTLAGIGHFASLTELQCERNQLTSLNLSGLPNLVTLYCADNQLTSLNFDGLIGLESLDCGVNPLTSLDVSQLTSLKTLYCYSNQLTSLDVSQLTSLTTLKCYTNQLTTLDVSKLTNLTILECYDNQLSALDITPLAGLTTLICGYQDYGSLTLVLTLTSAQKTTWDNDWVKNEYYNTRNVTLNVKD